MIDTFDTFYAALYATGCSLAFLIGVGVSELTAARWGRTS